MAEPGNEYLIHVIPMTGHRKQIDKSIHDFLVEKNLTQQPTVWNSEGPNVNVRSENRAINHLEMFLCHPIL